MRVLQRTEQRGGVDRHRRLGAHGGHIQVVPPVAAPALAVEVQQREAARGRLQGVGHEIHDRARVHQEEVPRYRRPGRLLIRVPPRVPLHAPGNGRTGEDNSVRARAQLRSLERGRRQRSQAARWEVQPSKARVARRCRVVGPAWRSVLAWGPSAPRTPRGARTQAARCAPSFRSAGRTGRPWPGCRTPWRRLRSAAAGVCRVQPLRTLALTRLDAARFHGLIAARRAVCGRTQRQGTTGDARGRQV